MTLHATGDVVREAPPLPNVSSAPAALVLMTGPFYGRVALQTAFTAFAQATLLKIPSVRSVFTDVPLL